MRICKACGPAFPQRIAFQSRPGWQVGRQALVGPILGPGAAHLAFELAMQSGDADRICQTGRDLWRAGYAPLAQQLELEAQRLGFACRLRDT
jgi:hypothetical protein